MPSCAHWSQRNALTCPSTCALSSEICTVDSEVGEHALERFAVSRRGVVRPRPARGLGELVGGWLQGVEVGKVLARALVHDRVELEVDLVDARGEVDRQRGAVAAGQPPRPRTPPPAPPPGGGRPRGGAVCGG